MVFGNEHEGVSQEVIENADGLVHIPMHGFTESFNISVAASLFLHHLIQSAETENIPDFYLTEEEKSVLKLQWYKSVVKNADIHEKAFYQGLK